MGKTLTKQPHLKSSKTTNFQSNFTRETDESQVSDNSLENHPDIPNLMSGGNTAFKPNNLLSLQRSIGNRAVQRLINNHRNNSSASHGVGCSCHQGISGAAQRSLLKQPSKGSEVQRFLTLGMTKAEMRQQLMASVKDRQLQQYIPSTGMGRFDAEYLPLTDTLYITVRPFIQFGQAKTADDFVIGGWTEEEEKKFKADFRTQCQEAWSGKFKFKCTKEEFDDLVVVPEVRVEYAKNLEDSHFDVKLSKDKKLNTGIGREQSKDSSGKTKNVGNFGLQDAPERSHDSASTRCNMATHDMKRINELLIAYDVGKIYFDKKGAVKQDDQGKLGGLVAAVKRSSLPGSAPVPLIATGSDSDYFNNDTKALANANKVKNVLETKGLDKNPVQVKTTASAIKAEKADRKQSLADFKEDKNKGYKVGGRYDTEAKAKIKDLEDHKKEKRVDLVTDSNFPQTWKGDPYSVLAHEFGHMLGNPDEYFEGGEEVLKQRIASLTEAGENGDPDKAREAKRLKELQEQGKGFAKRGGDDERLNIQQRYGALVRSAGFEVQAFNPSPTSSIMSAGADVLPQHYVTMWEALGKITEPVLKKEDWKIS